MAIKDADRTVQYVQSDRFFMADAKYRGTCEQSRAGPADEHIGASRLSSNSRHEGIHA